MSPDRVDARKVLAQTLGVLAVVAVIVLALRFGVVLVTMFVGVLLAAAVRPIVSLLERRVGRVTAAAIVHVLVVVAAIGFALVALVLLIEQVSAIVGDLPRYYAEIRGAMLDTDSVTLRRLASALPRALAEPSLGAPSIGSSSLLTGAAVVVLSFYWTIDGELMTRSLLLLVPLERRAGVASLIDAAGEKLSGYVRGQLIVCAAVGALAFVAYWWIGLPYAFALALTAGVLEAVPVIGPVLGAIPAAAVALTIDPGLIVWIGVSTLVIQTAENYLLVPRVMDRSVGVNPLVTLLAITGFGSTLGLVGAILAIPLAALVQLVVRRLLSVDDATPVAPEGRGAASVLRYDAQALALDVRKLVRNKTGASVDQDRVEDEVEAIANGLDRLLGAQPPAGGVAALARREPT